MLNNLSTPHEYPGKLFVVEGIDGSGKTTQLALLAKWLSAAGLRVFVTEWNSSALVKAATKMGKKKNALTPTTFSLLHATDFADRLLYHIVPPLKAGMIVLADRYAYTAFARDVARGVDRRWVRDLYSFAVRPDLALYFRVPIDVSLDRLMARRVKLKFYEAGMDMGWSVNAQESFRMFQGKVLEEYDRLVDEFGLSVIDASLAITDQQQMVRNLVSRQLEKPTLEVGESVASRMRNRWQRADLRAHNGHIQPGRYYGHGLPYSPIEHYPGKIIAIEGTDGVGRSTQIRLLREWLEVQGYGVVETGWTRSALMQPTIELAKSSNTLNKLTFVLLYATDFADRLEKEIIPALKAGFVVLSDRYIFSALARAGVRGVDRAWLRSLYGFAIAPHLVFYLKIDVDTLIRRVLSARGMDFWESGMDLKGGDDIYDSFRSYQNKLLREYASMADEFGFRVLDARRPVDVLQEDLRRQVQAFLSSSDISDRRQAT